MEDLGLRASCVRRSTCRVCDSGRLTSVLDYGLMPLAGGFVEASDPRVDGRFPLHLVLCQDCLLLQVLETVNAEAIFGQYSYASSVNQTLVEYFESFAREVSDGLKPDDLVVEFGCNDGILLKPLLARGLRCLGVDPSDVAVRASQAAGWRLYCEYFRPEVARRILCEHGPASLVTAHNVCAHVDDPNTLVEAAELLLGPEGKFVFSIHYQGDLLRWHQFDTVYHEHTCYYSLHSLVRLLSQHGMVVSDVKRTPIHCGSIEVTARRAGAVATKAVGQMLREEQSWDVAGFQRRVAQRRAVLQQTLTGLRRSGLKISAYGASGRATILLNYCQLGVDVIEDVSDLSPLRVGRVIPGVGIPIVHRQVFRDNPPDYALLTAWNYEAEVVRQEGAFLEQGGHFVVPLPDLRVVSEPVTGVEGG